MISFERDLDPMESIAEAGGPMKVRLDEARRDEKVEFSERNP